jgi:hypothetical protein
VSQTREIPSVDNLHAAYNQDGLLLRGYAVTWDCDRVNDVFSAYSLDKAVEKFMRTNPVLLYAHNLSLPPVGKIVKADIHRDKGLFITALMPRPEPGTFASEVWNAAKDGLLRAFSASGRWFRKDRGDHNEIVDCDLVELSLCPIGVNPETFATEIVPTAVKCLSNGGYMLPGAYEQGLRAAQRQLALVEAQFAVAAMFSRARS